MEPTNLQNLTATILVPAYQAARFDALAPAAAMLCVRFIESNGTKPFDRFTDRTSRVCAKMKKTHFLPWI